MLAISTAWNAERCGGWAAACAELVAAGRLRIALDGPTVYPDAAAAKQTVRAAKGAIVAAFAPPVRRAESGPGGAVGLASPREEERVRALEVALRTAAAAVAAGTGLVVLRSGGVPAIGRRDDEWRESMRRDGVTDAVIAEALTCVKADAVHRPRFLDALCRSLHALTTQLPDVTWLLETPSAVGGLPLPDEMRLVLEDLPRRRIAYWHDAGHAMYLGALGVVHAESWISELGPRTLGVTATDWSPQGGGFPPGSGSVDWTALRSQINDTMLTVLRLDPSFPPTFLPEAVRQAEALGL
jgi:sugar phosphate isomerase/epimerase